MKSKLNYLEVCHSTVLLRHASAVLGPESGWRVRDQDALRLVIPDRAPQAREDLGPREPLAVVLRVAAALDDRSPHPLDGHVKQGLPPGVGLPRQALGPKGLVRLDDAPEGLDELILVELAVPLLTGQVANELGGGLGYLLGVFRVGLGPVQLFFEVGQVLLNWDIVHPW